MRRALLSLLIVVLLGACSPYADIDPSKTPTTSPTPSRTATAEVIHLETPTPTLTTCTVKTGVPAGNLNIRTGAGTSYAVISLLQEGQVLTLTGDKRGAWIEVTNNHLTGWINSKYCKE